MQKITRFRLFSLVSYIISDNVSNEICYGNLTDHHSCLAKSNPEWSICTVPLGL